VKLPARALGIEFVEGRIHFVQMRRIFGAPHVTRMATLDVSAASGEAEVADQMSAFLTEKGLRCRRVVAGIPLKDAMIRIIELPGVEEKHLRQLLEFEIERSFPLAAGETYFDFRLIERIDDKVRLLVVAVERGILDRYRTLVANAGLPTMAITPGILADLDLPAAGGAAGEAMALVRSNVSSTEVAVLRGTAPAGIYRFPHGNGTAASGNSTSPEQMTAQLVAATRQACMSAIGEPRPARVITSGRALPAEVVDELSAHLKLDSLEPLGRGLELDDEQASAITAHALARLGIGESHGLPNLLPEDQRSGDTGAGTLAIGLQVGLAALLGIGLIAGDLVHERRQLSALRAELTELTPEVQRIKGLESDLTEQRKLASSFDQARAGLIGPLTTIRELARLLDYGAWISNLTIDGPKITITGHAENNDDVQQLKILLGGNAMFAEVSECSRTTLRDEQWNFKICATIVAEEPEAGQ